MALAASGTAARREAEAERIAGALPPLLIAARRIAETVAPGVHGRRRVGPGESFWQFRDYVPGDRPQSIDWRASARSRHIYVRETEWEAAATVALWRDTSASMDWVSSRDLPTKRARADLLLLALVALLLRGGERVQLLAPGERPRIGRAALAPLAGRLAVEGDSGEPGDSLPPAVTLPRHSRVVLFGDLLQPLPELAVRLKNLAVQGTVGALVQVLDPAEVALPYRGRVRFQGLEHEPDWLVPRSEAVREAYQEALARHEAGLAQLCRQLGWTFHRHLTNEPPGRTLLALSIVLGETKP